MRRLTTGLLGLMVVLSGCATTQVQEPDIQRISPEELEQIMPKPVPNLSLEEIVALSRSGTSPDEIIEKIKATESRYDLTPSQALELSKQGVNAKVLDYIHASREQALRDSLADEINKRERENEEEKKRLKRDYQWRSQQYYHPYFGYSYSPWWGYHPYYGRGFYRGHRFGYGFGW
ncbi:hypothetical protein MTYP_01341 [Methylophilaceae bacterium]|nr:hypothetical protein MTYP_01341 [Methylophilaceae bacterium]